MKITFVGHASVICDLADITLWTDPWLKGDAFNDSWALYPLPVGREEDIARVTHIWISHEHPDHLSIPTIKALPAEHKARITVLFQKHYDAEVLNWLKAQGFMAVVELPHGASVRLNNQCAAICYQVGHMDSALALLGERRTVLNLNDCDLPDSNARWLKKKLGHIDVLMDQFSVAGWCGNADDPARRRAAADGVLRKFIRDVDCFQPDYVLPFASFVRFSHAENAYMNSSVNSLEKVMASIEPQRRLMMYPGDAWAPGEDSLGISAQALARHQVAWSKLAEQPLKTHDVRPMDEILAVANKRIADIKEKYHGWALGYAPPVTFYVTDLDRSFIVDLSSGATAANLPEAECVVSLSSQAAWYTFAVRFGLPTLGVSGRYRINHSEHLFAALKKLGSAYSSGFYTKKAPRFGVGPRLFEFWWRRRRDVLTQFVRRLPLFEEGRAQAF
jgi:UDP-MurNAc hydroxylase